MGSSRDVSRTVQENRLGSWKLDRGTPAGAGKASEKGFSDKLSRVGAGHLGTGVIGTSTKIVVSMAVFGARVVSSGSKLAGLTGAPSLVRFPVPSPRNPLCELLR